MKTLLLMRHAKSSWKDSEIEDHERPLNKRGQKDAPMMGKHLVEKELTPQVVLSSTAKRARSTVEALVEVSGFQGDVFYLTSLYLAEPAEYFKALQSVSDGVERVLVVGHNPGLEGLLQILTAKVESLNTCALAQLALPIDSWKDLKEDSEADLVDLWRPRDMKDKHKK